MSADAISAGGSDDANRARRNFALRLAIGVTAGFAIAEVLDWGFSFLAPMLAAQFLIQMPHPPTLRQGLALIAIIGLATGGMALLAGLLAASPVPLILSLGLILYISYYAHARGAPEMVTLMLQISAVTVPVFAVISPGAGAVFASLFAKAGLIAVLIVWVAFAIFPAKGRQSATPAKAVVLDAGGAAHLALRNTLILLPILLWYLLDTSQVAVVMLVTMVMLLRQIEHGTHARMAIGLILANLLGGVVASVAYTFVGATDQYIIFLAILLTVSLCFAGQIALGGPRAALLAVAFGTFILLIGSGLTPLPGGSGDAFITRIVYILLAIVYTIGALSLFPRRPLAPVQA